VDLQVYDNESSCSQLCQCSLNDTVVCQSLPCTHSVACTHLNTVYGQSSYSAPVVKQKYCAIPARSVGRVLIQGRRQVKLCGVERHCERGGRAYNGGLGAEPTGRTPYPSPCKNSSDLYQFHERPLAKVGWTVHPSPPRGDATVLISLP